MLSHLNTFICVLYIKPVKFFIIYGKCLGHGCRLQQNGECTFFCNISRPHIYMASVCTFIHAVYAVDKYIKKEKSKMQTGKAVLEWYRPAHFMDGLFCQ